ncbi:MAG TPA: YjgP/YjgQ family permease [Kiloniellaceae bacterium]|nr:YjgP/YjgQ family permease [Kiloniellaceae bacterium]HIP78438.1 YjgP/YjgQ family permease [Kiloniellaceae bacterium]
MPTISSYLLRQTMMPLVVTVGIALLVLLTERMLRLLDMVLDSDGGLTVLLQMLAFLVPHYMALALPAAFFLGVFLAFSRLHHARELDALGSAGIGLPQLLRPVMILALVLTAVSAANFNLGQPYARYTYRALIHEVAEQAVNTYLQPRTFMEANGTTFMANGVRRGSREFAGVFLYEEDVDGNSVTMTAERGRLVISDATGGSTLVLSNGVRLEAEPPGSPDSGAERDGAERDAAGRDQGESTAEDSRKVGVLNFGRLQLPTNLVGQEAFRPRGEDERELTLLELWQYRATPPLGVTGDQMLAEFHDRLVRTFSLTFLPFLAVALAIGPRRSHQGYGIAAGLFLLIVYNQALSIGKSMSSVGHASALVGQWLPFLLIVAVSVFLFYRRAYVVTQGAAWPSPAELVKAALQAMRSGGGAKSQTSSE